MPGSADTNWFELLERPKESILAREHTEARLSLASIAPLPASFHIHNVVSRIKRLEELAPSDRRREALAMFAEALSQSGAIEVPLLHKLSAKEQGRRVQPVKTMFTEMAGLVATVVTRAPPNLVRGAACRLLHLCADAVASAETSIGNALSMPPTAPMDNAWIEPLVQKVYALLLPFMTGDETKLRQLCGRFRIMLKHVCQAVALLARLVQSQLQKRALQGHYRSCQPG